MECRERARDDLRIIPVFVYRGAAAELIHHYKTRERSSLAWYFSFKLAPLLQAECVAVGAERNEVILVPVPPRPEKLRSGKSDQVAALAAALARQGYQSAHVLARRQNSVQQKTLAREDRFKNASTAYYLAANVVPKRIILLDDVVTTGATLRACADIVRQAGAHVVAAAAIAAD